MILVPDIGAWFLAVLVPGHLDTLMPYLWSMTHLTPDLTPDLAPDLTPWCLTNQDNMQGSRDNEELW
jgi:hypothetical protein